ncbi:replication initiation protein [Tortoise microvirus 47]|nr:replication initiation protein [Tortoise microvirus 47]
MCLNPSRIPDVGYVACRECWQCRERKIDDWVGRNIAENKTAKAAHFVTLTYGRDESTASPDHIKAAVLTYSDVQKFLKLLRFHKYPVRYFVVGEYGDLKGRAHWHIILYWQDRVPDVRLRKNIMFEHWPHGWSYWDDVNAGTVRYCCKYLVKVMGDENGQIFGPMPSKKPPLGDAYFRQLAQRYVDAGIAPQDPYYSFPDVRRVPAGTRARTKYEFKAQAEPIRFMMGGKTLENFCGYVVEGWRKKYNDEPPKSEMIWAYLDKGLTQYVESISVPQFNQVRFVPRPDDPPMGGTGPFPDEKMNVYYSDVDGQRLFYSYDSEGELGWHEKIGLDAAKQRLHEEQKEKMRQAYKIATQGA